MMWPVVTDELTTEEYVALREKEFPGLDSDEKRQLACASTSDVSPDSSVSSTTVEAPAVKDISATAEVVKPKDTVGGGGVTGSFLSRKWSVSSLQPVRKNSMHCQ